MLNAKEFAEKLGRAHSTVLAWLRKGEVAGAIKHDSPRGPYYEIPLSVAESFEPPKMGRPWPSKAETKAKKKKGE